MRTLLLHGALDGVQGCRVGATGNGQILLLLEPTNPLFHSIGENVTRWNLPIAIIPHIQCTQVADQFADLGALFQPAQSVVFHRGSAYRRRHAAPRDDTPRIKVGNEFRGQHGMPGIVAVMPVFQSIGTAIHGKRGAGDVVPIRDWHPVLPVPDRDPLRITVVRSESGRCDKIQIQCAPGLAIVAFSGQLRVSAATIQIAVASIVVAHAPAVHQSRKLLGAPFLGHLPPCLQRFTAFAPCRFDGYLLNALPVSEAFFQTSETLRFMAHLAHEVRHFLAVVIPAVRAARSMSISFWVGMVVILVAKYLG